MVLFVCNIKRNLFIGNKYGAAYLSKSAGFGNLKDPDPEAYLSSSQASMMKYFCGIVNVFQPLQPLSIFAKMPHHIRLKGSRISLCDLELYQVKILSRIFIWNFPRNSSSGLACADVLVFTYS